MRFLHNSNVRAILWTDLSIDVIAAVIVWFLLRSEGTEGAMSELASDQRMTGVLIVGAVALVLNLIVSMVVECFHYRRVRRFTAKVERSLHGQRDLQFDEFREGDFNVLQGDVMDLVHAHVRQEELLEQEKGRMQQALDDISHQIKTPLASISLTTEQLLLSDMDPREHKMLVRRMMEQVKRIKGLIEVLLQISSMDADAILFHDDEITAQEWVELACDPLVDQMELYDKAFVTDVPEGVTIRGDKRWLTEALTNILKNCMEHTPMGGKIYIDVSDTAVYTKVVVRDTGMGIAPEDLPHIFKRFYKGKNAHGNSFGIGLAFTQMMLHEMGGTIRADNHPDGGARFTIHMYKVIV